LPQMDQLRSLAQVVTCMESKRTAAFAMRGYTLQAYSSQCRAQLAGIAEIMQGSVREQGWPPGMCCRTPSRV
jgi:hypothetical protein